MKRLILFVVCAVLVPYIAFADLTIYFLDVGQGDSIIIECDGEAMIIDGGLKGQSDKIHAFIEKKNLTRFKYVVATHPDNDHVGGLPAVFSAASVDYVFSPVKDDDAPRFQTFKQAAKDKKNKIVVPYNNNDRDYSLGNAKVIFFNSEKEKKSVARTIGNWFGNIFANDEPNENKENNDISLVVKIIYGETSFLFTGDIEKDAEKRLINEGIDLQADVLKVAHHGSETSSTDDFLNRVNPQYAIISCGKGYGHPKQETLTKLSKLSGLKALYRTDLQGDITCHSDGKTITFDEPERNTQQDVFKAPQQ